MQALYKNGEYSEELLRSKEVKNLINETYKILCSSISSNISESIPPAMLHRLENSVFIFSGFKTMHEMKEASTLLLTPEGKVKPFYQFKNDVTAINSKYNVNYLRAEYDFAVSSSQMAARWEALDDDDEGILLQYRTAKDDRVRAEHRPLDGITLSKKDSFWNSYYPPNDWGCRCTVVEVLADDYPRSDADEATAIGNRALSVKGAKSEIFKFNPGKEEKLFPPKHPYFCRQMGNCGKISLASNKNTPFCSACHILQDVRKEQVRQGLKRVDNEVKEWFSETLNGSPTLKLVSGNLKSKSLILTKGSIKNYLGHAKSKTAKELLYKIDDIVANLEYVGSANLGSGKDLSNKASKANVDGKKQRGVTSYNYYTASINGVEWRFDMEVIKNKHEQLYSVRVIKK